MRCPGLAHSLQRLSLVLLFCAQVFTSDSSTNSSSLRSERTPRVSGRIVKLYTHPKHEGFRCSSEGFHEDPDNCAVFYRCVQGNSDRFITYRFQCGPNTVFDPETGVCNFPSSTRRIKCGGNHQISPPRAEVIASSENEVDSNEPDLSPPSPISTRNPLVPIDHKLEITTVRIEPPSARSTKRTKPSTTTSPFATSRPKPSTVEQYVTSRPKPETTSSPIQISTSQNSSRNVGDQCTTDGFMGDSKNCRKFYRCVGNGRGGFIRYEFLCSETTVWDDNSQACNYAWAARSSRCGRGYDAYDEKSNNEKTESNEDSKFQVTTQKLHENLFGERVKEIHNVQSPQKQVIYKPVLTTHAQKLVNIIESTTQSQAHTMQNSKTQTVLINKQKTTAASQGYYLSNDLQQNHEDETTSSQKSSTTATSAVSNNDNKCTSGGFMNDSKDCKKFYRCVDNGKGGYTKYEFTCGEGTVWDSTIEGCNHAWAVKECGGKGNGDSNKEEQPTNKETTTVQTITSEPPKTTSRPSTQEAEDGDDDDDGGYNRPTHRPQTQQTTSTEKTATTEKAKPSSNNDNECRSSGFMGDSKDCKKFYRCVDNGRGSYTRHEFSCGEGTVWDAKIEACNHAWAVKECGENNEDVNNTEETTSSATSTSSKPTKSPTQSTTDDSDNDQGYNRPTQSEPFETTTTEKTKPSYSENNECTSSGFMGDTEDCKKFYRCVDNGKGSYTRYEFSCGEGTVWDSNIEGCNHAWAVKKCGGKPESDNNKVEQTTKEVTTATTSEPTSENHLDDEDSGYGQPVHDEEITTSTTQASDTSSKNYQCTSTGFIGDSKDCKKFYRCVDNGQGGFIRYEFSCGEGTVWDQSNEACNHAWAVKDCGGKPASENNKVDQTTQSSTQTHQITTDDDEGGPGYGPSSQSSTIIQENESVIKDECIREGFIGDSKDCKKFYRCVDNGRGGFIKYEFSCGEGTIWDSDIDACNHISSVKKPCSGGASHSATESLDIKTTEKIITDSSSTTQQIQTEENEPESTTKRQTKPSGTCKKEGFMSDENDCKKFYRCVDDGKGGYTKYEFTCGDGTVWDQDIQSCNHESMTKHCGSSTGAPSSSTENEIDSGYSQEPEHDEEVIEFSKPTERPSETTTDSVKSPTSGDKCTMEGFYPDSKDCKKFYRCVDNGRGGYVKYDFSCGEGTVWDQDIQGCNHPTGDSNCKSVISTDKPASETTPTSQEESTTSRQEETTSKQQQPTSKPTKQPSQSDGKCESEGFFADQYDCKKFYRCVDNGKGGYTKYDFSCGDGTVWDQEIQGCNFESNVDCKHDSLSSTSQQSQPTQSSVQQTTERADDEYISPESDNEQTTSKKPDSGSGVTCTSEGFYANENNCKKFYRCVDNGRGGFTKYDFDCGEGTAWDQDAQTCNHENSVNCQSSSQSSQSEPAPDKEDDEQSEDTDKPSSESSGQESTTQKQQTSNGKCEQEGYFGNPDNCKKFYRCVDNGKGGYTKYDFDCGEGTIWDQDLTTCNHPGDVQNPSCEGDNGTQSSPESSPSQSSSSATESSSSQNGQSSSSTQAESPSSQPSNISCPEAGFYANPNDCKKFYRCVDFEGDGKSFTVFHFDCGEGTVWDPNLDTCNYENSIDPPRDCSKQSQNQEVDNKEESTTSTTTENSTTEEPSTTESTTTTQKSTTEEQTTTTTTEKSTTQEETTTQQSTTTEGTTTTTEGTTTTTEESTTTTTEGTTTTTEGTTTTTEESTTTTTEGTTTTTEGTTTTTGESTTTTTTEESTTSTTDGQTTTTTEESTTTTTEGKTTTTTEESTTKESTTEESTTQESTTKGSTTEDSTTEGSSTESQTESQTEGTTEQQGSQTDSTTEESTTESSTEESGTTESSSSEKNCPETEEDQYLLVCPTGFKRHPKYCNLFYQCTEDSNNHDIKVATFHCDNNTIYDETQNKCVKEEEADQKCDGEMAERRRFKRLNDNSRPPISATNARLKCPAEGHFPFDKRDDCSPAFLKCQRSTATQKLRGFVYRCPEGYTYWSVSRRCELSSKMKECRTQDNLWKGRWEIPIETSNIAPWR